MTPNQVRAAQLLAQGHTQQEAADASGVSRRTIVRWLATQKFRDLAFGLVGTNSRVENSPPPQAVSQNKKTSKTLEDLIPLALEAVGEVLSDPDTRNTDKLKAAALVADWAGLSDREKMQELQALKVLIDSGWLPPHVLDELGQAAEFFEQKAKEAFGAKSPPNKHIGFKAE